MQNKEQRGYRIANIGFEVTAPHIDDDGRLSLFRTELNEADEYCQIEFCDNIQPPQLQCIHRGIHEDTYSDGEECCKTISEKEGIIQLKLTRRKSRSFVEADRETFSALDSVLLLRMLNLPSVLLDYDGFFLHASMISYKGRAILFTADKQMGKSTQAALWEKYAGAETLNGDRALIRRIEGEWYAFGSPYCGTSDICKAAELPIGAIVLLGKGKENVGGRAQTGASFRSLLSGASFETWNRAEVLKLTQLFGELIQNVSFYKYDCLPEPQAVTDLLEIISTERWWDE